MSTVDKTKTMICVKNCTGFDPISGNYNVQFGQSRALPLTSTYKWVTGDGDPISSVKCDIKDFGGISETIDLEEYTWECANGYYMKSDNRCHGKL